MAKYNAQGGYRAAMSGAIAGGMLAGVPGAVIGGLIGMGSGAFGGSEEDTRTARKAELLKQIAIRRQRTLREGTQNIYRTAAGQVAEARAAGGRMAASKGTPDSGEVYSAPAISKMAGLGLDSMRQFQEGTNRFYDQKEIDVESSYADRPIEPSVSDYVASIGESAIKVKQSLDRYNLEKQMIEQGNITPQGAGQPDALGYAEGVEARAEPPTPKGQDFLPATVPNPMSGFEYPGVNKMIENLRKARMSELWTRGR